jgi:serine/threonine protein kinase
MYDSDRARANPVLGNRYHLGELIGHGGLASVYRARDEYLGREVAIKIFRANPSAEQHLQLQQDEINTLAVLNHPYLVTLFDAGVHRVEAETRIYYAMELVEGSDLNGGSMMHRCRLDRSPNSDSTSPPVSTTCTSTTSCTVT